MVGPEMVQNTGRPAQSLAHSLAFCSGKCTEPSFSEFSCHDHTRHQDQLHQLGRNWQSIWYFDQLPFSTYADNSSNQNGQYLIFFLIFSKFSGKCNSRTKTTWITVVLYTAADSVTSKYKYIGAA